MSKTESYHDSGAIGKKLAGARTPFGNLSCVGTTAESAQPPRSLLGAAEDSSTKSSNKFWPKFAFAKLFHNCCNHETKAEIRLMISCKEITEFA